MALEFQTFSIVAGNAYCNADCFYCVSKMTTSIEQALQISDPKKTVDWRNFRKAAKLAQMGDATTVLITGKGEPTMFPEEITAYLKALRQYEFPIIELQTNGTLFQNQRLYGRKDYLQEWYKLGLDMVIISVVGFDAEQNRQVYFKNRREYPSLEKTIELIHDKGLSVRLGVIGLKDHIDTPKKLEDMVDYCKKHGVEQLTWRPVNKTDFTYDSSVNEAIEKTQIPEEQVEELKRYVKAHGTPLLSLMHGGKVYDFKGQNLCLTHSLTHDPNSSQIRSLIFYSTGEATYSWDHPGAIILGKGAEARKREKELLKSRKR